MILPPSRSRRVLAALVALLVACLLVAGPALAAPVRPRTSPDAALTLRKRVPSTAPKLDPALRAVASAAAEKGLPAARALSRQSGVPMTADAASVAVQAAQGKREAAEKAAVAAGGRVTGRARDVLRVSISPLALARLASSPDVLRVRRPARPRELSLRSEGVQLMGADRWQALGTDGTGVKIGVIDLGYLDYRDLSTLGYLPPLSRIHTALFDATPYGITFGEPGETTASPHGSAVAETLHDVAPGAELYLAAIGDDLDLDAAVEWMHANGVQVISMSLGWIGYAPLDGGGTAGADNAVNDAVDKAVSAYHMFWANAAGNFRQRHWRGDYVASSDGISLKWGSGGGNVNPFHYDGADWVEGILWWKDSWTAARNDYDLVLLRWDGGLNAWQTVSVPDGGGEAIQEGRPGDQPLEYVGLPPGSLEPGEYAWAVVNMRPRAAGGLPANNAHADFDFFAPDYDLATYVPTRSIMTPADNQSSGFMAVAAISSQWDAGGILGRPGFAVQEPYSSEGPNQNGFVTPEIAAPDDTANYVAHAWLGGGTFRGTSASAPHLAGAAALALARRSELASDPAGLEAFLKAGAIGLADPGVDTKTGWGAADLSATRTVDVQRLYGPTRYWSAIALSQTWPAGSTANVVLASGAAFPDALAGGSLAGALGSPVVLSPPGGTFPGILTELHRLTSGAARPTVYILGSPTAVSTTVENQLKAGGFAVVRKGGANRYETAALIARTSLDRRPTDTAFVVWGGGFPDGLSAAPVSYKQGFPVLPVLTGAIPSSIESVITQRHIRHAVILGSTRSVGSAVETRLHQLGVTTERWEGATRYDTMREVAENASAKGWLHFSHVGIASGASFADALAGGAESGRAGGAVLLSPTGVLGGQAAGIIGSNAAEVGAVRLYGGEPSLQGSVLLGARVKSDH